MSQIDSKFFLEALLVLGIIFVSACSDGETSDSTLKPDSGLVYSLYPNDGAKNDSAASALSHGVRLIVHPGATYELSFDRDGSREIPSLQLFRLFDNGTNFSMGYRLVHVVSAEEVGGRLVYRFTCEENDKATWATALELDGDFYSGTTNNVRFLGEGAFSDHLSLNLIVVGDVGKTSDGVDAEGFGRMLLDEFRKHYRSVVVDTLYIRYAHEHPTLGSQYPSDEPWIAGLYSDDMMLSELGGWPEENVFNALDIVYVYRINHWDIMGYAQPFSSNLGGGNQSTVVIGNHVKVKTSSGEVSLKARDILETALHETAHFFGLRHTTTTSDDFEVYKDASVYEDGLEDTPYCKDALRALALAKKNDSDFSKDSYFAYPIMTVNRKAWSYADVEFSLEDCPDASNYMFPWSLGEIPLQFSEQQLDVIRKNLMIFPH